MKIHKTALCYLSATRHSEQHRPKQEGKTFLLYTFDAYKSAPNDSAHNVYKELLKMK